MDVQTAGMTLEEQIGQVLTIGFYTTTPSQEVIDLIQKQHVGGIILFRRNIQNAQQVYELTQYLQRIAREAGHRYPLLIMIDQENGMVRRFGQSTTIFPGNMALGAIGSEQTAYDIALATGRELQALGINMNLAPDIDVNNNPANPVIGVRSFGENPQLVARLGAAMVRGYHDAGVLTTLKHFPGHGDTVVDSHHALPVVPHTMERLHAIELVPFQCGIEAGAESVMIAHLYLPALMQDEMLPATVSPVVVTGLLREKLGFTGLIVSDCMEMAALSEVVGTEQGTVRALQAGIDLVLVSHHYARQCDSISAIQVAIQDGTLPMERLRDAAEHVLQLKTRTLSWDTLPDAKNLNVIGNETHKRLRDSAYERSTTLVRDVAGLLPLRLQSEQRLLLLFLQPTIFSGAVDTDFPGDALVEQVQKHHKQVEICTVLSVQHDSNAIAQAVEQADVILVVTANAHQDSYQGEIVQHLLQTGKPVIGIAAYNPYDLLAFPELGTYLVTYEYTQPAFIAVARVLFGETQAQGHLPVSLE
ncbi:MAG: beta-N-acetylhexosaminidase [Ktedonobacteraceae bacterium]